MKFLEAQKAGFLHQGKAFNTVGHSSLIHSLFIAVSIAVSQMFLDNFHVKRMKLSLCAWLEQEVLVTIMLLDIKTMVKLNKHSDDEKEKKLQYYKDLSTTVVEK